MEWHFLRITLLFWYGVSSWRPTPIGAPALTFMLGAKFKHNGPASHKSLVRVPVAQLGDSTQSSRPASSVLTPRSSIAVSLFLWSVNCLQQYSSPTSSYATSSIYLEIPSIFSQILSYACVSLLCECEYLGPKLSVIVGGPVQGMILVTLLSVLFASGNITAGSQALFGKVRGNRSLLIGSKWGYHDFTISWWYLYSSSFYSSFQIRLSNIFFPHWAFPHGFSLALYSFNLHPFWVKTCSCPCIT